MHQYIQKKYGIHNLHAETTGAGFLVVGCFGKGRNLIRYEDADRVKRPAHVNEIVLVDGEVRPVSSNGQRVKFGWFNGRYGEVAEALL